MTTTTIPPDIINLEEFTQGKKDGRIWQYRDDPLWYVEGELKGMAGAFNHKLFCNGRPYKKKETALRKLNQFLNQ